MAMVLLLLIAYVRFRRESLLLGALALQILAMTVPRIFSRVAVVWLGLSHVLGTVMSRVLLTAVVLSRRHPDRRSAETRWARTPAPSGVQGGR